MGKRPKRGSEPLGSAGDLARLVWRWQSGPSRGILKLSLQHTWVKWGAGGRWRTVCATMKGHLWFWKKSYNKVLKQRRSQKPCTTTQARAKMREKDVHKGSWIRLITLAVNRSQGKSALDSVTMWSEVEIKATYFISWVRVADFKMVSLRRSGWNPRSIYS